MPTLYVTEYADIAETVRGSASAPKEPPLIEYTVAITGASVQSPAFNVLTRFICVHTDAICSIAVGTVNPTATTSNRRLPADQTEYRGVFGSHKLAVISNV